MYKNNKHVEENFVYCAPCLSNDKVLRRYSKTTSTHAMLQHVLQAHPDLQVESASAVKGQRVLHDMWKTAESSTASKLAQGANRKFKLARELAILCAVDMLPFSIVDGRAFRRFLRRLGYKYEEIPSRTTVSRSALNDAYEYTLSQVANQLKSVEKFALTTDIWTDGVQRRSYVVFNLHYIDNAFEVRTISLKTESFPGSHTAIAIRECRDKCLRDFSLDPKKLIAMVTDSAANMRAAFRNENHVRCNDHKLHNAIVADLVKSPVGETFIRITSKLREIHRALIFKRDLIEAEWDQLRTEAAMDFIEKIEELVEVRG